MKEAIRTTVPHFTRRMVKQYAEDMYLPALQETAKGLTAGLQAVRTWAQTTATEENR